MQIQNNSIPSAGIAPKVENTEKASSIEQQGSIPKDRIVLSPPRAAYEGNDLDFLPRTVMTDDGMPGDPINMVVKGTKEQIIQTFEKAGWIQPEQLSLKSAVKMIWATITGNPYPNAPVSTLYFDGTNHPQDLAFERPSTTTKQRDHLRLWNTGHKDASGQDIWAVAATEDTGIGMNRRELGITHRIDSNVDEERNLVYWNLLKAGAISQGTWERGITLDQNGGGDWYHTDGGIHVIEASPSVEKQSFLKGLSGLRNLLTGK